MAISFWGRSMAISLWAVHWPFFYWPFDGHFPCDWVLVLCGRGPSAPARRVSTGLVSPVITAFRHFPPFAFNMLILASLDPMLFFFCVYIFIFLLLLTTTTLFTNTAVLCRCKGSKRRLMVVFTDVVDLASEYGTFSLRAWFSRPHRQQSFSSVYLFVWPDSRVCPWYFLIHSSSVYWRPPPPLLPSLRGRSIATGFLWVSCSTEV